MRWFAAVLVATAEIALAGAAHAGPDAGAPKGAAAAGKPDLTIKQLSERLDDLYRSESSRGRMRMTVVTPHYERTLSMEVWTLGLDNTLIRILSPHREKGTATLKRGTEMWNYLPKIRKVIRIPPSMMMASWMGSDFTNDDLVRETTWEQDYSATRVGDPPDGEVCVDYVPHEDAAVTWSRVRVCFDRGSLLPVRQLFYDEKQREARVMTFSDVKELGGRRIPTRLTLLPKLKEGRRTEIVYEDMAFDVGVADDVFSIANLRRSR